MRVAAQAPARALDGRGSKRHRATTKRRALRWVCAGMVLVIFLVGSASRPSERGVGARVESVAPVASGAEKVAPVADGAESVAPVADATNDGNDDNDAPRAGDNAKGQQATSVGVEEPLAMRTQSQEPTRTFFEEAMQTNQTDLFFDAFFKRQLGDIRDFDGVVVSRTKLNALVARSSPQLSLYRLSRQDGGASSWEHVSGPLSFWSTNDFHAYVREHISAITRGLPESFRESYFLINNYDEPQAISERCGADLSRLSQLHANAREGVISPGENIPVWSMSKIRGCHKDLLFPFPDYFVHLREQSADREVCASTWRNRSGDIAFRGSTTGFGDTKTNLRARTLEQLIQEPGFNVGFTESIQGFQKSWAPHLFREKMSGKDFCNYKAIMDIDGNAHSFNRQLLIAKAGAVMVRVNVFTDWFADGITGDEFCYVIDPSNVLDTARRVRASLSSDPARAEEVASAYNRLAKWAVRDDVAIRYLHESFSRYIAAVQFAE
jgi:hypothetical protein